MSGAALHALYDLGYAESANILGTPYAQYRPNGAATPIAPGNLVTNLNAWITTDAALKGTSTMQFGKPQWYAAVERNGLALGDYLVGDAGTFFVSSVEYPSPVGVVYCNRTIQLSAPLDSSTAGANAQRWGTSVTTPVPYLVGWPAYLVQLSSGSKMTGTGMGLPSDAKLPGVQILMSGSAVGIRFNDIVTDDFGQNYTISSPEKTTLGWRMTAEMWPAG